jgi:hypothetical protein
MTDMIKLANGSEVPVDVFYTWSANKQYNLLCPNRGMLGKSHNEESRAKMSALKKGKNYSGGWNKGQSLSEETRAKMSAAHLGRPGHTKNKGKTHSVETKAKIGLANSLAQSNPVMTPLGEFPSSKLAAEAYGLKSKEAILYRIKTKPTEYYYIDKDAK